MRRRTHLLDVFTDTKHAGNPLAIVLDSEGLDTPAMQAIARNFNVSETVFVSPPRDPVNSAALRIFTPTLELPFAGHPTIGTAILLAELQTPDLLAHQDVGVVLEEPIGLITCGVRHRRGEAAHARFEMPRQASQGTEVPSREEAAALFGLALSEIGFGDHEPTCFSVGPTFTFIPVASLEVLGRATMDAGRAGPSPMGYWLYTPVPSQDPHHKTRTFRARMLARGMGMAEDPATGAAAAAFAGALLVNERLADGDHDCVILQGVEMGRPSRIGLAFVVEGGRLQSTAIGGSAVLVSNGTIEA